MKKRELLFIIPTLVIIGFIFYFVSGTTEKTDKVKEKPTNIVENVNDGDKNSVAISDEDDSTSYGGLTLDNSPQEIDDSIIITNSIKPIFDAMDKCNFISINRKSTIISGNLPIEMAKDFSNRDTISYKIKDNFITKSISTVNEFEPIVASYEGNKVDSVLQGNKSVSTESVKSYFIKKDMDWYNKFLTNFVKANNEDDLYSQSTTEGDTIIDLETFDIDLLPELKNAYDLSKYDKFSFKLSLSIKNNLIISAKETITLTDGKKSSVVSSLVSFSYDNADSLTVASILDSWKK